ncbi:MAG: phage protein Gp37 [Desulfobulbaceae bacterium]|jgi:hypothetical protein
MIETIQDAIIDQLETITDGPSVGVWQGDIDDLLKTPQKLPALHVIYQGADFEPFEQAGDRPTAAMDFLIVLVGKSLKSRAAGASSCYTLIESVRSKLIGYQVEDYDFLRPVKEDLILAEGGVLVYGMTYRLSNVLWEGV